MEAVVGKNTESTTSRSAGEIVVNGGALNKLTEMLLAHPFTINAHDLKPILIVGDRFREVAKLINIRPLEITVFVASIVHRLRAQGLPRAAAAFAECIPLIQDAETLNDHSEPYRKASQMLIGLVEVNQIAKAIKSAQESLYSTINLFDNDPSASESIQLFGSSSACSLRSEINHHFRNMSSSMTNLRERLEREKA